MSGFAVNAVCGLARAAQTNTSLLSSISRQSIILTQIRNHNKHWNPKYKKLRAEKVIKIKLPDYQKEEDEELAAEKVRTKMKEQGLQPSRPWVERPIFISCTGAIFEEYVPPEGDGKFSAVSGAGAKQKVEFMTKKGKSYFAVKKIRTFLEDFSPGAFEEDVQETYIKAHEAIANKDKEALRLLVTEKALPEVMHNTQDKTIHWKFIQSLTLPRVVHARCTDIITKDNVFGQITVRFHTQQTLAVYDRFGRLIHGSEFVKKDVLEYVVYENHLANKYGAWRIHGKIIPPWMPEREHTRRTYLMKPPPEPEQLEEPPKQPEVSVAHVDNDISSQRPAVA
ncbi:probable 39S ribosomal protein L45, mitochondrial [Diachasma alloeum]|uniref:probable 39S ribosomal protein L45, mitochondrial n=1 Tax=Diachasma alloeum TaxID=454923 RepID=UPI0007381B35|nr:probable 39S ribosomal protein L45, mitochondrial [Diachasma alloeum]